MRAGRKTIIFYSPCIEYPHYIYRRIKEKEKKLQKLWEEFKQEVKRKEGSRIIFYPFSCVETCFVSRLREPRTKNEYDTRAFRKLCKNVVGWIKSVIDEIRPSKVIFVGVAFSPSCGVFNTTIREKGVPKKTEGSGVLFDEIFAIEKELKGKGIATYFFQFYKDGRKDRKVIAAILDSIRRK